jgi:uncharacterized protein
VKHRWFLPETPDFVGLLGAQLETTDAALTAFAAWAHGDASKSDEVRALEHRADDQKRELWRLLRTAFVTPIDAEDLFVLSAGLDEVLNAAKDTVREADLMLLPPDAALAAMADVLVEAVHHLGEAFARLTADDGHVTEAADATVKSLRSVERVYRHSVSALLENPDLREVIGRRELYARLLAMGEQMRTVAERVWYAIVKEG